MPTSASGTGTVRGARSSGPAAPRTAAGRRASSRRRGGSARRAAELGGDDARSRRIAAHGTQDISGVSQHRPSRPAQPSGLEPPVRQGQPAHQNAPAQRGYRTRQEPAADQHRMGQPASAQAPAQPGRPPRRPSACQWLRRRQQHPTHWADSHPRLRPVHAARPLGPMPPYPGIPGDSGDVEALPLGTDSSGRLAPGADSSGSSSGRASRGASGGLPPCPGVSGAPPTERPAPARLTRVADAACGRPGGITFGAQRAIATTSAPAHWLDVCLTRGPPVQMRAVQIAETVAPAFHPKPLPAGLTW